MLELQGEEGLRVSLTSKGNDKFPLHFSENPGVSISSSPADLTGPPSGRPYNKGPAPQTWQGMAVACLKLLPSAIPEW